MLTTPDARVKGMLFWLIGDLGGTTPATPALVVLAIDSPVHSLSPAT
jgi:hypothetical protein